MQKVLFWLYLCNAVFIIIHEIDSAFWKEWVLYKLVFHTNDKIITDENKGVTGFLVFHFPALFVILYGLVSVSHVHSSAPVFSFVLCGSGMFAFIIHMVFLKKGFEEFKTPVSLGILGFILLLSIVQFAVTLMLI